MFESVRFVRLKLAELFDKFLNSSIIFTVGKLEQTKLLAKSEPILRRRERERRNEITALSKFSIQQAREDFL